jgi:hypothetical protein
MQVARHIACDFSGRSLCTRFATVKDFGTWDAIIKKLQGPNATEPFLGTCAFSSFHQRDAGRKDTQERATRA